MSNRFYVNDVQIFGNNEMFQNTYTELEKQGAEWTEDGTFGAFEIKDPQGLMDAVEKDSLLYLKKLLTKDSWSSRRNRFINRPFSRITDKHLLLGSGSKDLVSRAYTRKGEVRKNAWIQLNGWVEKKRIFTSLNLYYAIKNEVEIKENKLVLKKDGKIIACMF